MGGFSIVIFVVCGIGILVAIVTVLGSKNAWAEYQERGMVMERERASAPPSANTAEAAAEIRQMLEASNARRIRRGDAPLDIDAEIRRLNAEQRSTADQDPDVVAEMRLLVEKRNARRVRAGEPPLNVDEEVARRLAELGR